MEAWRSVWREGFVPVLSTRALVALRDALRADDLRLMQGATTCPPPEVYTDQLPVEAACALGYCGWQGENLNTVAEVQHYFASVCFEADQHLKEVAACRWFLDWFDDTPREQMLPELLAEVELAIGERLPSFPLPVIEIGPLSLLHLPPGCLPAAV